MNGEGGTQVSARYFDAAHSDGEAFGVRRLMAAVVLQALVDYRTALAYRVCLPGLAVNAEAFDERGYIRRGYGTNAVRRLGTGRPAMGGWCGTRADAEALVHALRRMCETQALDEIGVDRAAFGRAVRSWTREEAARPMGMERSVAVRGWAEPSVVYAVAEEARDAVAG